MKLIYTYILMMFIMVSNAQTINVPDVNFKNKLLQANFNNTIALDQFGNSIRIDTNNDSEIQASELNIVRTLNISDCGIADLTGLSYFVNLRKLDCSYNYLISTIDATPLTNLIRLECQYNRLTSINIAGLAALEYFNCSYNQLPVLTFTGNTYLNILYCTNNLLTSLTITNATHLFWVYCSSNRISNLNFAGSYNLERLYCDGNLLNSLDLSAYTNLHQLDCSFNAINNLNVNGLVLMEDMRCHHNALSVLNLSGLTNLYFFDCAFNQLTTSGLVFSQNEHIAWLYCENNFLTDLSLTTYTDHLYDINCDNNQLQTLNIKSPTLRYLSLVGNPMLSTVILETPNLSGTLDVSNRQLTTFTINNGYYLRNVLCNNNLLTSITALNMTNIREFYCNNNNLSSLTMSGLVYSNGDSNSGLKILDCSNNLLTTLNLYGTTYIYGMELNFNQNLFTTLDFSNRRIRNIDFGNNPNLVSVNLKNNYSESALWFANTPNLQYICEDANQVAEIQAAVNSYGYNCSVVSNCSLLNNDAFAFDDSLKIYPNPVTDMLNIEVPDGMEIKEVIIYNTLGQTVLVSTQTKTMDVSNLKSGTYFMSIRSDEMNVRKTFIKL